MKGKNRFSPLEIEKIKILIKEKLKSTPDKQKAIRGSIRRIGFYYSDYRSQKDGYTVRNFEELIESGEIIIEGNTTRISLRPKTQNIETKVKSSINNSTDLKLVLQKLKLGYFNPLKQNITDIPDLPGNYILCLQDNAELPTSSFEPVFTKFEGLRVIYTGIASQSLRCRDFKQHFKGNNAGRSTLRKSIGVLNGYKQIPRDKNPESRKTKFSISDEIKLSHWMCNNMVMFYLSNSGYNQIENKLIHHFNPPLNLKDNSNPVNLDFRLFLSKLRSSSEI